MSTRIYDPPLQRTVAAGTSADMYRVAVLVTCFNRRELTIRSLTSLHDQEGMDDISMQVILIDDGCTDDTAAAVGKRFPDVRILQGKGGLFWNGGMRKAFEEAIKEDFDAYVWFNDDTFLYPDALHRLIACATAAGSVAIVAGSTCSPVTGELSYGGFVRHTHGLLFRLEKIQPHASALIACDTVNGNFTLIPRNVAQAVGNIEPRFRHQFGDVDYGLRAKRLGFEIVLAPGYLGECAEGSEEGTWKDSSAPLRKRWKNLMSPKGVPFKEWLLFTRRHYGWRWIHYVVSPYAKTLLTSVVPQR